MTVLTSPIRHAVFPVAGLGTRFLPATKSVPKEMLPVVDRPLIAYAIEDAMRAGIRELVFVTSRSKKALEDYLDTSPEVQRELEAAGKDELLKLLRETTPSGVNVVFLRQSQPMGTGHAVLCARPVVRDDGFAVLLPDELMHSTAPQPSATQELVQAFLQVQADVVGVAEVPLSQTGRYGIVQPAGSTQGVFEMRGMVEKPRSNPPSTYAAIGRYVFGPGFMQELQDLPVHAGGERYLTDAIARKASARPGSVYASALQARRFDCGDKLGYLQATVELALARENLGPEFGRWLASRGQPQE